VARFHAVNRDWSETVVWSAAVLTSVLFFAGLFAHELSHALVAKARGLPIHKITLYLLGGMAQMEEDARDPGTEFLMAIAGPIASGAIGLILLAFARALGWIPWTSAQTPAIAILVWLGYINLVLGAFNMIPGYPMDGGRVLRAIVWWITGKAERSTKIAAKVGQLIGAGFIAFGIISFFGRGGFGAIWFAFIGWFVLQAAGASLMQLQVGSLLRGLLVRDVMSQDCPSVDGSTGLQDFVDEQLLKTGRRCFLVVENHRVAGLITPHEVRNVERSRWPLVSVREAMRPVGEIHSLSPDVPAMKALEMMGRENVNQLPVVVDGRLEGIVARAHLLELIHSRAEVFGR
jgi:Zn-dependent protease/CBS domain-containing protein